jgi:transposase
MVTRFVVEHLNHLGIVAEVCREIGVAEWLDQQEPGNRQQVSVGTATVALVLNGLGLSNRRLYLVPQFFADKPVEHLLGPGIMAEDLNDDCLGRTLDWLYDQDVTRLFAGLALRARRAFDLEVGRLHADTTSFSVHGQYASDRPDAEIEREEAEEDDEEDEGEPAVIAVTYGYSRDHRDDLKQWMLALVTSGEGVPQFLQPLDGNASDKRALLAAVTELTQQLQESGEAPGVYVADSGLYSAENMARLNQAGVQWVSRVPETSTAAQAIVQERLARLDSSDTAGTVGVPDAWQSSSDGTRHWWSRQQPALAQGPERWIVARTQEGEERARATLQRQAELEQTSWEKRLWHLGNQTFACQPDAAAALAKTCQRLPVWFQVQSSVTSHPTYPTRGRPRKDAPSAATPVWQIHTTLKRDPVALEREALRRAAYIVGTNLLDTAAWPDEAVLGCYREQSVVERGFAFLKDPQFLASSVFVKRPERIMALAFVMTLCLLVYKLAEVRIRQRLAATGQAVPDQARKPTARPTLRWLFQCFEGIDLLHITQPDGSRSSQTLRLEKVHRLVLHLLGPAYENCYFAFQETAE